MTATCRSCGAEIFWTYTQGGQRMPLDAEPILEAVAGAFIVNYQGRCLAAQPLLDDGPFYMNHFATCPQGKSWSKGERT